MWVVAEYQATTLFSLKPHYATSSGGRTLLLPTPYAIRMALLDVVCRVEGVTYAESVWDWLRTCPMALKPAEQVVVNNTFTRILKPRRKPAEADDPDAGPFQKSIGYREYAYLDGAMGIALWVDSEDEARTLQLWLAGINYLGKRGGFVQLTGVPGQVDELPGAYIPITTELASIPAQHLLQPLDECDESLTFAHANIYDGKRVTKGKQRVILTVALPYRMVSSSRGYTHYRLEGA